MSLKFKLECKIKLKLETRTQDVLKSVFRRNTEELF